MKNIITSLAGGLVEKVRPDLLNDGQVQTCTNMKIDTMGVLIPVNDLSVISDLGAYDYVWLWRMYKKPYVYNGSAIVESPYNYVYLCYDSTAGTLNMLGYYGLGSFKTSTLQFKTGDSTHGTISLSVAQKPSLAITNIRCTIVDGVSGNNARYIEIDDDGIVRVGEFSNNNNIITLNPTGNILTELDDLGIGDDSGSFFGYRAIIKDSLGGEVANTSFIFNNTVFNNGETQQVYDGWTPDQSVVSGYLPKKFVSSVSVDIINMFEGKYFVDIYRTSSKYTEGSIPIYDLRLVDSAEAEVSFLDTNGNIESASTIELDIKTKIASNDVVTVGNSIIAYGTNNNISFPLGFTNYAKFLIRNRNSRNYINGIVSIDISDYKTEIDGFTDLSTANSRRRVRFFMADTITPIPCIVDPDDDDIIYLRIPMLYALSDLYVYMAYYPDGSTYGWDSLYDKSFYGFIEKLTGDGSVFSGMLTDFSQRWVNRYNIKDSSELFTMSSLEDNAVSSGTIESNRINITSDSLVVFNNSEGEPSQISLEFLERLSGNTDSYVLIKDGFVNRDIYKPLYISGYFILKDGEYPTWYKIFDDYGKDDGGSNTSFGTLRAQRNASNELNIDWFTHGMSTLIPYNNDDLIFIIASKTKTNRSLYLYNITTDDEWFETWEDDVTEEGTPQARYMVLGGYYIDGVINLGTNAIKSCGDVHIGFDYYLDNIDFARNIKNGMCRFFEDGIGCYGSQVNKNISIKEVGTTFEQPSAGIIRWSDPQGLTFPTLNELVVGREIIKIVPRLGSKDQYESIVDVYTKSGIYILSIDKLSSSTQLIPLTGESGTFILQNKDSIVTVDSSNYFVSNNTLYRQTGESFTDLSSGKVNIDCDKITYFPEYKAIGLAKTGVNTILMYDVEKNIYFKQSITGVLDFADVSEEGKRLIIFSSSVKSLSTSLVTTGLTVKSKRFYVGLASLIRFNIEFEGKVSEDNLFTIRTIFEGVVRTRSFSEVAFGTSITLDIESNKWYHFPNGLICEYFEIELYNYTGIKKIEIEYKPRGRR